MKLLICILLLLSGCIHKTAEQNSTPTKSAETLMSNKWFVHQNFSALEIEIYTHASDKKPAKIAKTENSDFIKMMVAKISAIPAEGQEMIEFTPAVPYTVLSFKTTDGKIDKVELYGSLVKTPATSFNSAPEENEKFVSAVEAGLRSPEANKYIPMIENFPVHFPGVTITYLAQKNSDFAPVTVKLTHYSFELKFDKGGEKKIIEISAGQVAPKPYEFEVAGKKAKLTIFESGEKTFRYPYFYKLIL
jgi:hypothetical protein